MLSPRIAQSCLFYSAASLLDYIGFKEAGHIVARVGLQYEGAMDTLGILRDVVMEHVPKCLQPKRLKKGWDYLSLPERGFAFVILETKDGGANHAVAIYKNMIFDSNEHEAILLSKETLNYCVNPGDGTKFKCINSGFQFAIQGRGKGLQGTLLN